MSTKKIKYHSAKPDLDIPHPIASSKGIPDWFRRMRPVTADRIASVKRCVPFLDAMTAGYLIPLPADVEYSSRDKKFRSPAEMEVVTSHAPSQTAGVPVGDEYDSQPWKFSNTFHIKTPKGYSTLFVHPLNRSDLPFHAFSAIVDTDVHPVIINFPFVIRKDFNGIIPAGTPMIQAIPFKRDDWKSEVVDTGKPYTYARDYEVINNDIGWYRSKWWMKKRSV
jgi:hypothetical protein